MAWRRTSRCSRSNPSGSRHSGRSRLFSRESPGTAVVLGGRGHFVDERPLNVIVAQLRCAAGPPAGANHAQQTIWFDESRSRRRTVGDEEQTAWLLALGVD